MAFRLPRRVLFFIVFTALCFAVLHLSARPVRAEGAVNTHVYGRVVDNATHQFISEARVFLWNRASRDRFTTETNTSGFYEVKAIDRGSYDIYVSHDNSSTEGVDYVPAHRRVDVGETAINVSFRLLPGASIRAEGEFRPFGSPPVFQFPLFGISP